MKYLIYVSAAIISFLLISCKDNIVTQVQTDPSLLFSANELTCDFHDSLKINDTMYYFVDSMKYLVSNRNFTKIKIAFDAEYQNDTGTRVWCSTGIKHADSVSTPGDTLQYDFSNNQSYVLLYNILYPADYSFNVVMYLVLYPDWAHYSHNPKHSDYIKFKNIKVYKAD